MRIGCVPHLSLQRLQAFLGAVSLRLPDAELDVAHLRTEEQVRRLSGGTLDIGVIDDLGRPPGMRTAPLFDGEWLAAVLPRDHRFAMHLAITAEQLAGETLLMFPRSADPALHDWYRALADGDGYGFGDIRETGDADLRDVLLAVAEARGITLGPRSIRENAGAIGAFVASRDLSPPRRAPGIAVAWSQASRPAIDRSIGAVIQVAAELRQAGGPSS